MSFTNKDHIIIINLFNNNRYKRPIGRPYPTCFSSGCQDRLIRFTHPSLIYIYCWTCSRPEYSWNTDRL